MFRFQQPKRGIFHTKSLLLLFSAGRLFRQQKVGHGNETKCFRISRNSSFHPNKKNIFQIPYPKFKKKKKYLTLTETKKYVQIPATQTRHFSYQILAAVVFSW